ncbi:hypothetical protein DV735_g503, partial [Chaetothyriales sp. CBS 134920]
MMSDNRANETALVSGSPISPRSPNLSSSSPAQLLERRTSIRFSAGTNTSSRSPMSRWRDADESTPIRTADATVDRAYDTHPTTPSSDRNSARSKNKQSDGDNATGTAEGEGTKQPWYKGLAEKYGSITLENKGSVARDHLALERTFLAWLRTSLAFASIGIAVTQLFRLNTSSATRSSGAHFSGQVPSTILADKSVPAELLPYLQQAAASAAVSVQTLGPTLLDQLLGLPPVVRPEDFDEDAAKRLRHVGKPLGATFLIIAILILLIGAHRYFESQYWIIRGKFPASRGSIFLVASIAGALIVASLIIVIVLAPTSYEKATGIGIEAINQSLG